MKAISLTLTLMVALTLAASPAAKAGNAPPVHIVHPWSRPATGTGVLYFEIDNKAATPDELVSASSQVSASAQIHESVTTAMPMSTGGSMQGMSMPSGVTAMHPVASVPIPANGTVLFKPGGYHVMLIGLKHDLHAGDTVPFILTFKHAGRIPAVAIVKAP